MTGSTKPLESSTDDGRLICKCCEADFDPEFGSITPDGAFLCRVCVRCLLDATESTSTSLAGASEMPEKDRKSLENYVENARKELVSALNRLTSYAADHTPSASSQRYELLAIRAHISSAYGHLIDRGAIQERRREERRKKQALLSKEISESLRNRPRNAK